jgi:hypothetical protein
MGWRRTIQKEIIEMDKLLVSVGQQLHGCTFQLHPRTIYNFKEKLAGTKKFSGVYVDYTRGEEPETLVGPMSQHIITLLTGLSESDIENLGGFAFVEPVTGKELFKKQTKND